MHIIVDSNMVDFLSMLNSQELSVLKLRGNYCGFCRIYPR